MSARNIINRAAVRAEGERKLQAALRAYENPPSLASRRAFLKGAGAGVIVTAMARRNRSWASIGGVGTAMGGIGSGGAGYYPTGHWIAAKQPLQLVYPIQDGSTSAWAPFQFACWDSGTGYWYSQTVCLGFGAFPLVFILMAAPSWLTLGASIWNAAWNCGGTAPAVAGYGIVSGTPTGALTGQTDNVWVRAYGQDRIYYDVKWNLNTSGFIANGGIFGFVANGGAANPGSPSNPGTAAEPWDELVTACGSTYSAVTHAGCQLFLRGSSVPYVMPTYADNTFNTSKPYFELSGAKKPVNIMQYHGETATLDGTTAMIGLSGPDVILQNLSVSGGMSSQANYQLITHAGNRQTIDRVLWSNGVYGSNGTNVPAMMYSGNLGAGNYLTNIAHTGWSDNNHESGNPGNNYSGPCMYSVNGYVCQYGECNSPSANSDGTHYMKSAIQNGSMTANLAIFSGCAHGFDFGQEPSGESMANCESRFNTGVGVSQLEVPQVSGTGPLWVYRCSLKAGSGRGLFTAVPSAAFWDANACETATTPQPDGGGTTGVANVTATSGLLNSDGTLTSGYSSDVGLVGAQIS